PPPRAGAAWKRPPPRPPHPVDRIVAGPILLDADHVSPHQLGDSHGPSFRIRQPCLEAPTHRTALTARWQPASVLRLHILVTHEAGSRIRRARHRPERPRERRPEAVTRRTCDA